jgi:cation diffusion facilitator family transporter
MHFSAEKQRAALFSILSNTVLIISKLAVGIISNSISIISEAVHSFTDLLAAVIAYFSIKKASSPPDKEHPFGHGKYEDFSGFIEGILILLAAGYIIFEAVEKIISNKYDHINTTAGIIVMLVSVIANICVSRHLFNVAKKTDSMALLADAEHLRTDILTSLGVLLGLILIKVTHIQILDPIVAIFVALIIIKAGLDLCFASGKNLLDTSLPENEQKIILDTINKYIPEEIMEIKELKSRKAGAEKLIELVIIIPKKMTIEAGHELCDRLEDDLQKNISNSSVIIHLEPCKCSCSSCQAEENCKHL